MAKQRLKKDGTPDKRYGKKKGGKIQEIIDSKQAPGVHIAAHHKADYSGPRVDMEEYKRNTNGKDPHEPLDHSIRKCRGGDWDVDGQRRGQNPVL